MLNTDSIRDKILGDARRSAAQLLSDAAVPAPNARAASEQRQKEAEQRAVAAAQIGNALRPRRRA